MDKFLKRRHFTIPLWFCALTASAPSYGNELALGRSANIHQSVPISISQPVDVNFKAKDEILGMRGQRIQQYQGLLRGQYRPDPDVFGLVEDNRPWWGLFGSVLYGPGMQSIQGPSLQSCYLFNPFILVGAQANSAGIWDPAKVTHEDLQRPDFPFYWRPVSFSFDPANKIAHLSYDVVGYHRLLKRWRQKLKNPETQVGGFSLIAYNARDFGFRYLYPVPELSLNMKPWSRKEALFIPHMLHCGGSCGYPGGCNNVSPRDPLLTENSLTQTPARAYIKLWRDRPTNVEQPADMAFVIDFI